MFMRRLLWNLGALVILPLSVLATPAFASRVYSVEVLRTTRNEMPRTDRISGVTAAGNILFTEVIESESGLVKYSHRLVSSSNPNEDIRFETHPSDGYRIRTPNGEEVLFRAYQPTTLQGQQAVLLQENASGEQIAHIYAYQQPNAQGSEWMPVIVRGDEVTEMIQSRPPNSYLFNAIGINDSGTVLGDGSYRSHDRNPEWWGDDGNRPSPFLYQDGDVTFLGTLPGFFGSEAADINNAGDVVGMVRPWSGGMNSSRGFLYEDGLMHNLDELVDPDLQRNWVLTHAFGINDASQIIALGMEPSLTSTGFVQSLLRLTPIGGGEGEELPDGGTPPPVIDPTPIPEPTPLAVLGVTALALAWRSRRRAA